MHRHLRFGALLCAAALAGCGADAVREITGPVPGSQIKFFNFGVNSPGVNFYAGTQKMTAIGSATGTESTIGTAYGSAGAGGVYTAIAPGQYALSGRIAAATDKDLVISTVNMTLVDGKKYSFYQSGFYNSTTKTVDAFVVEDPLPATTDYSVATVRFVNAISNANPMALYAVDTTRTDANKGVEVALGGPVAYKSAGAFVTLPPGTYNLTTRYVGASANVIARGGVGFAAGAVYTISARGDITITSTTATNRPQIDNTVNR